MIRSLGNTKATFSVLLLVVASSSAHQSALAEPPGTSSTEPTDTKADAGSETPKLVGLHPRAGRRPRLFRTGAISCCRLCLHQAKLRTPQGAHRCLLPGVLPAYVLSPLPSQAQVTHSLKFSKII